MLVLINKHPIQKIADEKVHNAVVVDIVGLKPASGGYDQVRVVWEVEQSYASGRRLTVTKFYESMQEVYRDFECVLGSQHPLVTDESRDLELLYGVPCRVDIVHNQKRDKTWFPHVQTVMPATGVQLEPSSLYVRMKDRHPVVETVQKAA